MTYDPKPFSDFVQTNVVAGFLVFYGDFIGRRDAWPIHEFVGPLISVIGLVLYAWNWWWGWRLLRTHTLLSRVTSRILIAPLFLSYVLLALPIADAFVHWHHEAAPEKKSSSIPAGAR